MKWHYFLRLINCNRKGLLRDFSCCLIKYIIFLSDRLYSMMRKTWFGSILKDLCRRTLWKTYHVNWLIFDRLSRSNTNGGIVLVSRFMLYHAQGLSILKRPCHLYSALNGFRFYKCDKIALILHFEKFKNET